MKKHEILQQLNACAEAQEFASNYNTMRDGWNNCPRGDWMLWLASRLKVDKRTLTLAKALCAKTVIHLMKDERSINAVDVAEQYGRGNKTEKELKSAAVDAAAAYASYAAYAAYAAAYTAYAAAADAADAAAYAAYAAKENNQKKTAYICREVLTKEVFSKLTHHTVRTQD